ncbi:heavy metal translocating P-type ATPase [Natrarchaeobius oligotrophus]|uniref:Cation-translocating P-type ATPase n=1 Tax=Natrarchaeobius chitinivorans TaxID=1679083 RepID=A0A3N6MJG7_NATCH|nr:cation-translocating P-type ATPase [Natrarchaeobius chitinivorans]RQH03558.1 cation-translocating P-type ATPase [Natrarchaeobius chitinivorans]
MERERSSDDRCHLCGTTVGASASALETAAGDVVCSPGCRDVAASLPPVGDGGAATDVAASASAGTDASPNSLVRTYVRIDGMYSATCEAFLESVAERRDGVESASASYVTEAVTIDHDPDRTSATELRDALTGLGYTAYLREEAAGGDDSSGGTRRSREMSGLRKRRSDDALEFRYVVGVVFGTFLLVPYVAVFYPVFLSSYSNWGVLRYYDEAFASLDGLVFLPVFFVVTGLVLYLTGLPLLRGAYVSLRLRRPNAHLLAALTIVAAYAYGTLSIARGDIDVYYDLTVVVAALVMAAIFAEATIKREATGRLTELTSLEVDEGRLLADDGSTRSVPVDDLAAGDRVLVRAGERVPIDGILRASACTVDEAVVTGESLPVSKEPGEAVVGGSVVTDGSAIVAVDDDSTGGIDRLARSVWDVQSADHGDSRRADALAATLTPIVLGTAILVGAGRYALGDTLLDVWSAVLLTVVVASPWALALAVPASVAASLREASERGLVVFDETVFERLRDVDVVVFDKTGTLTTGEMTVLEADAPADLLRDAAAVERRSGHPVARALTDAFGTERREEPSDDSVRSDGGSDSSADEFDASEGGANAGGTRSSVDDARSQPTVREFRSHANGVEGVVDGRRILVGHPSLFRGCGWSLSEELAARVRRVRDDGRLPIVVGRDGRADGVVVVGDEPRAGWDETIASIGERDRTVVVLTGDDESAAERFAEHPDVDRLFARVPPGGKRAAIRRLKTEGSVAMVGDGTNDAPALAEADLGISLGSATALAADAADVATLEDDLAAVERSFRLASAARRRFRRTLGLALSYNAVVLPIAAVGALNPLFATGAAVGCAAVVAANASRPLVDE